MKCANKNHPSFIKLAAVTGELNAAVLWDEFDGNIDFLLDENDSKVKRNIRKAVKESTKLNDDALITEFQQSLIDVLTPFGITVESINDLQERTGYDAVGVANMINKTILISRGRMDKTTLPEEASHFFIELIGDNNPLVQRMLMLAEESDLYNEVFEEYNEMYGGNKDRIVKEVAGKLLADALLREEERLKQPTGFINTAKLFWNKIINLFKQIPTDTINKEVEAVFDEAAAAILAKDADIMSAENLSDAVYFQKATPEERKKNAAVERVKKLRSLYTKTVESLEKKIEGLENQIRDEVKDIDKVLIKKELTTLRNKLKATISDPKKALTIYALKANEDIKKLKDQIKKMSLSGEIDIYELRKINYLAEAYSDIEEIGNTIRNEMEAKGEDIADIELVLLQAKDGVSQIKKTYIELSRTYLSEVMIDYTKRKDLEGDLKLTAGDLRGMLVKAEEDVSWFNRWAEAIADSKDTILAIASRMIHTKKAEIRVEATKFMQGEGMLFDKLAALEKFQKEQGISLENKQELYDFMLEKVNGKLTGKIVSVGSEKYEAIQKMKDNDPRKQFYNFYRFQMNKANASLPMNQRRKGDNQNYIPSVIAKASERIYRGENIGQVGKETWEDLTKIRADEQDFTSQAEARFVPVKYTAPIGNTDGKIKPKDLSYDLGSSLESFVSMSINNKKMSEILNEMEMLKDVLAEQKVVETRSGIPIIGKKKVVKEKEGIESKIYEQFVDYIAAQVYGERKKISTVKVPGTDKVMNVSKILDTLNKVTSLRNLGFNLFSGTSNVIFGQAMNSLEALSGQFYDAKALAKADLAYTQDFLNIAADNGQRKPKSKTNLLNLEYDVLQEYDEYGNHIESSTFWGKFFRGDFGTAYSLSSAGEHMLQSTLGKAMMMHKKFTLKDGSEISLYDAYTVENGKLKLNEEVAEQWSQRDQIDFSEKIKAISQKLHGIYNNLDQNALQREALGRVAMLHRKWLIPAIKRRYGARRYNERLEAEEEGSYITAIKFFNQVQKDFKGLKAKAFSSNWNELEKWEQQNMIRALMDIAYMAGVWLFIQALAALAGDDDEEKTWFENFGMYQVKRFQSEVLFYINPVEAMKILRSPSAGLSTVEAVIKLMATGMGDATSLLTGGDLDRYEKKYGIYEKGDPKIYKRISDVLPLVKEIQGIRAPENRLKFLQMK